MKNKDYLFGVLFGGLSGGGELNLSEPYMIISSASETEAEDLYNARVPVTSYYPAHLIAVRENGSWTKISDYAGYPQLVEIVDGLLPNSVCHG